MSLIDCPRCLGRYVDPSPVAALNPRPCPYCTGNTPAAQDWRRHLLGNPQADGRQVAAGLARLVSGIPLRSNVHERDAAGAALAVARGWRPVPEQLRLAQLEGKKKPGRAKARKAAG